MTIAIDPHSGEGSPSATCPLGTVGERELTVLTRALATVAPGWSVELSQVFLDANIVIMPPGADDRLGPTFIVRCAAGGYDFDQFRWGHYDHLETCRHMPELILMLRMRILTSPDLSQESCASGL